MAYQFDKDLTSKFKFRPNYLSTTTTLTIDGINASITSADTICNGVSSLMAISGYTPSFNNATRTATETVEEV